VRKSHGGKRKGAGAPRKDPGGSKREEFSYFLTKEEDRKLREIVKEMRKAGESGNDEFIG